MITAHEALRQLAEVCKLVDFADCAERPELWHKINAAQQVAEEVLKRPEQAQPTNASVIERFWSAVEAQQAVAKLPGTPEELIAFIGPHFDSMEEADDPANVRFQVSVHDLASSFRDWFDLDEVGGQPPVAALDAQAEYEKAFSDSMIYGTGFLINGKHVHTETVTMLTASQPAAAPSGDAWQPIETAPKDGTRILIGRAGHPWTFVAGWNPHRQHWAYGSDAMSYLPMATHWKPSPLAPTATKE